MFVAQFITCTVCGKKYKSNSRLKRHIAKSHADQKSKAIKKTREILECSTSFSDALKQAANFICGEGDLTVPSSLLGHLKERDTKTQLLLSVELLDRLRQTVVIANKQGMIWDVLEKSVTREFIESLPVHAQINYYKMFSEIRRDVMDHLYKVIEFSERSDVGKMVLEELISQFTNMRQAVRKEIDVVDSPGSPYERAQWIKMGEQRIAAIERG